LISFETPFQSSSPIVDLSCQIFCKLQIVHKIQVIDYPEMLAIIDRTIGPIEHEIVVIINIAMELSVINIQTF